MSRRDFTAAGRGACEKTTGCREPVRPVRRIVAREPEVYCPGTENCPRLKRVDSPPRTPGAEGARRFSVYGESGELNGDDGRLRWRLAMATSVLNESLALVQIARFVSPGGVRRNTHCASGDTGSQRQRRFGGGLRIVPPRAENAINGHAGHEGSSLRLTQDRQTPRRPGVTRQTRWKLGLPKSGSRRSHAAVNGNSAVATPHGRRRFLVQCQAFALVFLPGFW